MAYYIVASRIQEGSFSFKSANEPIKTIRTLPDCRTSNSYGRERTRNRPEASAKWDPQSAEGHSRRMNAFLRTSSSWSFPKNGYCQGRRKRSLLDQRQSKRRQRSGRSHGRREYRSIVLMLLKKTAALNGCSFVLKTLFTEG